MSTTSGHPGAVRADQPAERALFRGLFDDAAVFPPGLVPLPRAVNEHLARRALSSADLVGPLLVPASAVAELLTLERTQPLDVALVARPGTDLGEVAAAVARLDDDPDTTLTGVEIGWSEDWHQALGWGAPLSLEIPRDIDPRRALSDIEQRPDDPHPVQAKYRTGSTGTTPVPTPTELATFIRCCVDSEVSFKLTGGLHHAFTHTTAGGEDQFGFLNVLSTVRWCLNAAEVPELEHLLAQRDPQPVVEMVTRMSEADASIVRAFFTSYGCCGVMDPIGDLVSLGLVEEAA